MYKVPFLSSKEVATAFWSFDIQVVTPLSTVSWEGASDSSLYPSFPHTVLHTLLFFPSTLTSEYSSSTRRREASSCPPSYLSTSFSSATSNCRVLFPRGPKRSSFSTCACLSSPLPALCTFLKLNWRSRIDHIWIHTRLLAQSVSRKRQTQLQITRLH
jgi:hypothetical protein